MGSIGQQGLTEQGASSAELEFVSRTCGICGQEGPMRVVARGDSTSGPVQTRVGVPLDPCVARRVLCSRCGALEGVYEPSDALKRPARKGEAPAPFMLQTAAVRRDQDKQFLDAARERFEGRNEGTILHIGCGEGHLTRRFAHQFQSWRIIGIDLTPNLMDDWPPAPGRPGFIREQFAPGLFAGQRFDIVLADDFLLGGSLTEGLERLRQVCQEGAFVRAAAPFVEETPPVAHFWDLPVLVSEPLFKVLARRAGFEVTQVSGGMAVMSACEPHQCEEDWSGADPQDVATLFSGHLRWWRRAAIRAERSLTVIRTRNEDVALDGAGVYSGVLAGLVPSLEPAFFVDDDSAGKTFCGLPVLSRREAARREATVLVCAPSGDATARMGKLSQAGLKSIDLLSDAPLTMSG